MKANDYQKKISDVNKQARAEIYALMKHHNIDEIHFDNILKKNGMAESERAVNHCALTEAERIREMLDDHLILMNTGVQIFTDCHIVSIRVLDGEYLGIEYKEVDENDIHYIAYTDAYTTLQILGLLEDFFNEFDHDPKTDKIRFKTVFQVMKYVDGEAMPMASVIYNDKSDAIKDMLKTVTEYPEAEMGYVEIDTDRIRFQTKLAMITYQVEELYPYQGLLVIKS